MNTTAPKQCEAAIQGRNTVYFHRCANKAKTTARTYMNQTIEVCGLHARNDTHLIQFKGR